MRIGMMADIYRPHISGVTNYIVLNKRHLEQAGHEVYVFTFGESDPEDEPRVVRTPGLPISEHNFYFNFRYSHSAKALLQTMDIVHVHHPFISGQLALRYCRPLHIPIVFTNHTRYDLYAQTYLPLLPSEVSTAFLQTYLPFFCASVNLVISPSAEMADILRQLGVQSPIEVIPNGVELERFRRAEPYSRADFGFAADDILLIYIGRLAPEKNLPFLLRTFAGVVEAVEKAHLLLVGGGPEEDTLKAWTRDSELTTRVHFIGLQPYDTLPRYLAMSDLFVTASVTEVHPLSVIEAMAAGLPVAGLRSVGVGDVVQHGVTGLLAESSEVAFAAQLTRLCLDADLRRRLGAAARQAAEQYAIERTTQIMVSRYEHLIRELAPRRRSLRSRLQGWVARWHS